VRAWIRHRLFRGGQRPSTAEFIGIKLIQKFVSDEITLSPYHDGTAPAKSQKLLEEVMAANRNTNYRWDTQTFLEAWDLKTPKEIIDAFDDILFQRTLSAANKDLLFQHLTTDENGNPSPLDRANTEDYQRRVQELAGLILSLPRWHFQ